MQAVGSSPGDTVAIARGAARPSTTSPPTRGLASVRVQGMPLRRWWRTTPGTMRVLSLVLAVMLVVAAAVLWSTAQSRRVASREVGLDASPQLAASAALYGALADADAAASTDYLQPGATDVALMARYDDDIANAGTALARVGQEVGDDADTRAALATIAKRLPEYTGLVEQARANNRAGNSVGAAYLRQASRLMREEILPAATVLFVAASERLDHAYAEGTADHDLVWVGVLAAVTVLAFVLAGVYLARRTRRTLNLGVTAAFVLVVVTFGWTLALFATEQSALAEAQRDGSDAVQTLAVSRILLLRAYNDDNQALIARGNGPEYLTDFATIAPVLRGVLRTAAAAAARTGDSGVIDRVGEQYAAVVAAHDRVRALDDDNRNFDASQIATTEERAAVGALDQTLADEITRTRAVLLDRAADARRGFTTLLVVGPLLLLAALALVLVGIQPRIEEYR